MKRQVMLWGLLASVACALAQGLGWLDPLERWAYDVRARRCQLFMPPADNRVVHVDIDDGTLGAMGHWPLDRGIMAAAIGELDRAGAAAIGMDFMYVVSGSTRPHRREDGTIEEVDEDALLEAAIRASGKVVLVNERLLPRFAGAAAGVGDARIVPAEDGTIRQIHAVDGGQAAGTQSKLSFDLRVACVALHVPLDKSVVEWRGLRLRPAGGGDRFVPLTWNERGEGLMQVPALNWTATPHVPFIKAYEPIECEQKIVMNDLTADRVIGPLAEIVGFPELKAVPSQPSDWPAYRSRIERLLQEAETLTGMLKDLGSDIDSEQRKILDALQALRQIQQVNDTLAQRIDRTRAWLKGQVNGRVVLVGATATGLSDNMPTSLNRVSQGVVVHGMAVNGILSGELWRCMPRSVDMLATFAAGLLMTWVAASARTVWMVLLAVAIGAIYAVVNGVIVFDWGNVILSAMGPIVAIAGVTVVALSIRAAAGEGGAEKVGVLPL